MATVKKAIKKAIAKKPAAKQMQAPPMMQAPPSASSPMGGGPMMKSGGTLSPSKKAVSKNIGNLNKAKAGAKMKMGGKCKNGC